MAALALTGSTACSTIEIVHEPVGCLGQPNQVTFGAEELEKMESDTFEKVLKMASIYHERIESQCQINAEHDKLHGDKH